jgi:HK97 gp10 family phage protein
MVTIEGADELQEFFEELPNLIQNDILPDALLDGANTILETARDLAPRRTGALADSLHIEPIEDGYRIVADVDYANCVNDGTPHAKAQPFLDDAIEQAGPTTLEAIDAKIDELFEV